MQGNLILAIFLISLTIPVALIVVNFYISKKETKEREKPSPFECGFDPICSARLPFSMQFFLITVIFLIFDVEITLLLPASYASITSHLTPSFLILSIFFIILILGLYLEWHQGALEWLY